MIFRKKILSFNSDRILEAGFSSPSSKIHVLPIEIWANINQEMYKWSTLYGFSMHIFVEEAS